MTLPRGGVERRLVLVDLALRTELALRQLEAAVVLQLGVGQLGLGNGEISLGLLDRRLELHLLDLVEQVARLDVLALLEQDLFEEALDAGAQLDLVDGLDPADELEGLADAFGHHRPHADRRGRDCRRRGGLGRACRDP